VRLLIAAIAFVLATGAASAACEAPAVHDPAQIQYFLGIEPSDSILDVWCRLQALQGEYQMKIVFPAKGAERVFNVTFDGTPSQDKIEMATMIQSVLPTAPGPALDENGMDFGAVLEQVVQGRAPQTQTGIPFGIPEMFAGADDLLLWQPISLRLRPVKLAGVDFVLSVNLYPSIGRYIMAMNGSAEDLVLRGWHEHALRGRGPGRRSCPDYVPKCEHFGDVVDIHAAWVVENVVLSTEGTHLSSAALTILGQIEAQNARFIEGRSKLRNFNPTHGAAEVVIETPSRVVRAVAEGDDERAAGTQAISIMWRENAKSRYSYAKALYDYANDARKAMVMNALTPSQ